MSSGGRDAAGAPFVVTLVFERAATKRDALEVIAFVSGGVVQDERRAFPRVPLGRDEWAEVQIPRFADPPPIAVDVCSDASIESARIAAVRLARALADVGWTPRGALHAEEI